MRLTQYLAVSFFTLIGLANANPVITFSSTNAPPLVNGSGHTGKIAYDPTGIFGASTGPVAQGTNIDIDSITGTGTYANTGITRACFSCTLNFTTGAVINDQSVNGNSWTFSGGGAFSVNGTFDLNGNGILDASDTAGASGLLLSGIFSAPVGITTVLNNDVKFVAATIINTMNNGLEGFYGNQPASVYAGDYSQTFTSLRQQYLAGTPPHYAVTSDKNGMTSKGVQIGILNGTINDTLVPEPLTTALYGTVGLAVIWIVRKRRKNTAV